MSKCQGRKSLFDSLTIKTIAKISSAFTQIIVFALSFVVEVVLKFLNDKSAFIKNASSCISPHQHSTLLSTKFYPNT